MVMNVIEPATAEVRLQELLPCEWGARVDQAGRETRLTGHGRDLAGDGRRHGLVTRRGLARVGDADDLAERDRRVDRDHRGAGAGPSELAIVVQRFDASTIGAQIHASLKSAT